MIDYPALEEPIVAVESPAQPIYTTITGDAGPEVAETEVAEPEEPSRWERFGRAELDALADALGSHVPRTEAQGRVVRYMLSQVEDARHGPAF